MNNPTLLQYILLKSPYRDEFQDHQVNRSRMSEFYQYMLQPMPENINCICMKDGRDTDQTIWHYKICIG